MESVVGALLRQLPAYDDPLVERQTVDHQQRDLVPRRVEHVPREKARDVVEHDGRHRRQVDQSPVAFLDPLREGGVDSRSQCLDLSPLVVGYLCVQGQRQSAELRPEGGEMKPSVISVIVLRYRFLRGLAQTIHAVQFVCRLVRAETDGGPGLRQRGCLPVRYRSELSVQEQAVHVGADILVLERQVGGSGPGECVVPVVLAYARRGPCGAVEVYGPALLQECEECISVRDDDVERPVRKPARSPDRLHEVLIQHQRDLPRCTVAAEQHGQQVGRFHYKLRHDSEDVPQHELLGGVVAAEVRAVTLRGVVQRVEVLRLQCRHNRTTQVGEQISDAEGKPAAGLENVVGQ